MHRKYVPVAGHGAWLAILFVYRIACLMNIHVLPFVGYGGIIAAGEVTPILPVAGEKQPDNITKFFFDALIQFVVSEVLSHTFSTKKNTHNTHNLYHSLDKSADDKLILFFFFTENRL